MYASLKEKRRIQRKLEQKRRVHETASLASMFSNGSGKMGTRLTWLLNIPAHIMIIMVLIN